MNSCRIALANLRFPKTRNESVALAENAIAGAAGAGAQIVCFPECFVPGYRALHQNIAPPDAAFLEGAWATVAHAAATARIVVILGAERVQNGRPVPTAAVFGPDGARLGFQDKVQLDPSEEATYGCGTERHVFEAGGAKFGIAICHEGWRYPETVRWAAKRGAQIVFHPHFHAAEPNGFAPTTFADPRNTFHEKAMLCRAAENTCYFASVNYASERSPTTSAIVNPDSTLFAYQPYGVEGLLVADLDLRLATGLLAKRAKT